MAVFNITRWPVFWVFCLAGGSVAVFAFVTVNLFSHAMANLTFIKEFGLMAIQHGALLQVAELMAWGALSLGCWLTFKACEQVLVNRYFGWAKQCTPAEPDTNAAPKKG
ncbi:hypothetical protein ATO10_13654 [Actibacterium atlanticum]|uniref:Uncharacterized protein n=1 Tax=Actibacterium atlanticum TaxID=1461693 RepID=A0A058ZJ60_9RHOB|nr:hypothetical protein [Actibacterium atlanticum]KCV81230.1 hypothetical protein ATO10_13654 [Actibacterium atlanticum]